jgi:putative SOS response-associated peptidase YedK
MNDRTPVILPPDRIDAWLDPNLTDKDEAHKLISGMNQCDGFYSCSWVPLPL